MKNRARPRITRRKYRARKGGGPNPVPDAPHLTLITQPTIFTVSDDGFQFEAGKLETFLAKPSTITSMEESGQIVLDMEAVKRYADNPQLLDQYLQAQADAIQFVIERVPGEIIVGGFPIPNHRAQLRLISLQGLGNSDSINFPIHLVEDPAELRAFLREQKLLRKTINLFTHFFSDPPAGQYPPGYGYLWTGKDGGYWIHQADFFSQLYAVLDHLPNANVVVRGYGQSAITASLLVDKAMKGV